MTELSAKPAAPDPESRAAVRWFVGAVVLGGVLTYCLAAIDRRFYDTQPPFFNFETFAENQSASTLIPSEVVLDAARTQGTLSSAVELLTGAARRGYPVSKDQAPAQ